MKNIIKYIENTGVLPVINVSNPDLAIELVDTFIKSGLTSIEVTLRSEKSLDSLKRIVKERPDFIVGAGTVLTVEQCEEAISAGADFIVSPGFDLDVCDYCSKHNVLYVPGVSTPSEIQQAVKNGLSILKFFPAELSGGVAAIKLLSGPYPQVKFLPTGGITLSNLQDYLRLPQVIACGGSFMAPADMLKSKYFASIEALSKEAYKLSLGFELSHIGINNENAEEAYKVAYAISNIFMQSIIEHEKCFFTGTIVEVAKCNFPGAKGHVAIKTNNIQRAVTHLEKLGVEIDKDNIKKDDKGIVAIYLKDEIGGFAFHLLRK